MITTHAIEYLSRDLLDRSPTNPRKHFDEVALAELAESLKSHGVLQNLLVRPKGERFEVVSGERRYRAAEIAGLDELPCAIREMTDEEVLELQIVENLQREDISPLEEAEGYASLLDLPIEEGCLGWSVERIAERVKKSDTYVRQRLAIRNVPSALKKALANGDVAIRVAELVGGIPDSSMRQDATTRILHPELQTHPLTAEQAQQLIQDEYMVSLSGAFFDPEDEELTDAGACAKCDFLTANDSRLKGLLQVPGRGGRRGIARNLCMKPSCFREKEACAWADATDELPKDVDAVLSPDVAVKLFSTTQKGILPGGDYVDLRDKPGYEDTGHFDEGKLENWRAMLKGAPDVPVMLARNPHTGRVFKVVSRELAITAVTESAKKSGSVSPFEHRPEGREDEERFREDKRKKAEKKKLRSKEAISALKALGGRLPEVTSSIPHRWAQLRVALLLAGEDACRAIANGYLEISNAPTEMDGLVKCILDHARENVEENKKIGNDEAEVIGLWLTIALVARDLIWDGLECEPFELMATITGLDIEELREAA